MNAKEIIELSDEQNIEIALHLPEYEGMKFIMVGGAITMPKRFATFTDSLCHLYEDGIIRRYNREIGSLSDIEVLNIIDAECVNAAEQSVQSDATRCRPWQVREVITLAPLGLRLKLSSLIKSRRR